MDKLKKKKVFYTIYTFHYLQRETSLAFVYSETRGTEGLVAP